MDISLLKKATKSKYIGLYSANELRGRWKLTDGIAYITKDVKRGSVYFLCSCIQCNGHPQFVSVQKLKSCNKQNSGGCHRCSIIRISATGKNSPLWEGYGDIPKAYFNNLRLAAVARKWKFDITIKYMWKLFLKQEKQCKISGKKLTFGSGYSGTASIDRIDSSIGYVVGNVQWLHKTVNLMKRKMSDDQLIEWCDIITDYQRGK